MCLLSPPTTGWIQPICVCGNLYRATLVKDLLHATWDGGPHCGPVPCPNAHNAHGHFFSAYKFCPNAQNAHGHFGSQYWQLRNSAEMPKKPMGISDYTLDSAQMPIPPMTTDNFIRRRHYAQMPMLPMGIWSTLTDYAQMPMGI